MNILDKFSKDWKVAIADIVLQRQFELIGATVAKDRETKTVYPEEGSPLLFKAFENLKLNDVAVVILGQDPYHDGSFNGYAFGNGQPGKPSKKISPSLRNVIKEAERSLGGKVDPSLDDWVKQGVLLINTAHTVVAGDAGSHLTIWRTFTDLIIEALNQVSGIVWMLWGNEAHKYEERIYNKTHAVIKTGHPSPLNRTNPFVGSDCFLKCNELVMDKHQYEINWTDRWSMKPTE